MKKTNPKIHLLIANIIMGIGAAFAAVEILLFDILAGFQNQNQPILLILALVFFVLGIAYRFIMVTCPFCGDHLMGNKKIPQICPGCGSDLHKMEEYKGTEESDDDSETEAQ